MNMQAIEVGHADESPKLVDVGGNRKGTESRYSRGTWFITFRGYGVAKVGDLFSGKCAFLSADL